MKKFVLLLVFCFIASTVFAGGVLDNNNNNLGDVLVGTGLNNGAASIGTWTDPDFLKGKDGANGYTPIKGVDYSDGLTPVKGVDYFDGVNGKDGKNGLNGKDLKDQYKVGIEFRVLDTKKTTWLTYYNRDFNNDTNEIGVKVQIKLGKSYEEKLIEKLKK